MAAKGPDAFRTISEVAEDLDLPQHVLRFWETRFTQIKPMKRGGGRRYYRPDDIDLLRGIRHLLYGEGYTIRGVQRILKEQGGRFVVAAGRGEIADLRAARRAEDEVEDADEAAAEFASGRVEPVMDDRAGEAEEVPEIEIDAGEPAGHGEAAEAGAGTVARVARRLIGRGPDAEPAGAPALSAEEVRRLQSTMADLLEMKRLLDQAR